MDRLEDIDLADDMAGKFKDLNTQGKKVPLKMNFNKTKNNENSVLEIIFHLKLIIE